jgi:hypothetical protein
MKNKVSYEEYLMLEGLRCMAKQLQKQFKYVERSIADLLQIESEKGYGDYYGHVSDSMFEEMSAKELLDKLGIKIETDIHKIRME